MKSREYVDLPVLAKQLLMKNPDQKTRENFLREAQLRGLGDAAQRHAAYAIRLAQAEGELIYEEMHKLFSLIDNLENLLEFGFELDSHKLEEVHNVILARLSQQKRMARLVAEDKGKDDRRTRWHYSYALDRS